MFLLYIGNLVPRYLMDTYNNILDIFMHNKSPVNLKKLYISKDFEIPYWDGLENLEHKK